jgi:hypothetical protein
MNIYVGEIFRNNKTLSWKSALGLFRTPVVRIDTENFQIDNNF